MSGNRERYNQRKDGFDHEKAPVLRSENSEKPKTKMKPKKNSVHTRNRSKSPGGKLGVIVGILSCILIVSGIVLAIAPFGNNSRAVADEVKPQEILPTTTYTYDESLVTLDFKTQDEIDKEKKEASTYLIPPKAKVYDPIVFSYPPAGKRAAITFDDGPDPKMVDDYLSVLEQNKVKASFFMLANSVQAYPDQARKVRDAGHDVVSHSQRHAILSKLPTDALKADFANTNKVFKDVLGYTPKYMRPPYGSHNDEVLATAREYGQIPIYWSIDTNDWRKYSTETMVNTIKSEISDGAIILMHEGKPNTLAALPEIIKTVRDCGYEIVPLSELLSY
ncbi:MAG: polysaccharide deacetylase family protein [Clostridiales bacterium]